MKKLFVVSVALLCLGLVFTGCSKKTEADLQQVEQDVTSGADKGELVKDAETVVEDVKADVKEGVEAAEEKAKEVEGEAKEAVENLEKK